MIDLRVWLAKVVWVLLCLVAITIVAAFTFIALEYGSSIYYENPNTFTLRFWGGANPIPAEVLRNLGLVIVAIIGLPLLVWRSITAHRQAEASFKQVDAANRNLKQAEHGLNVDRLQKAIEGIGAESAPVREASVHNIGVAISLEPEKFYSIGQKAICAHMRDLSLKQMEQEKRAADRNIDQSPGRFPYNYEILDAFGAFSELKRVYGPEFDRQWKPNLLALRLFNFMSQSTGYVGVSFNMSKLTNTDFVECNFSDALFEEAVMNRTSFIGCDLNDSVFRRAEFKHTTFKNCDLTKADFSQAKLDLRVNSAEADHSTKFIGCTLKDAKVPIEYIDLFPKGQIEEILWFDGFGKPIKPHKMMVVDPN